MNDIIFLMLITLGILAIIDIVVGVSNDAANFLNSAVGSKALSFKNIMIIASLGIAFGSLFSSGMMEIARSGIFVPSQFSFNDVMILFLAVMISDVILLDIFNSLGLPTSTTVSIVFELLGAAVCLALYNIYASDGDWSTLPQYINTSKASEIVYSILLSVLLSFSLGMLIQYISRVIFTFNINKRLQTFGGLFGGFAIAALSYFILIKGMKTVTFITPEVKAWIDLNEWSLMGGIFVFSTLLSYLIINLKYNIFKLIIGLGTFGLALSFAGNDLVNFIGVPVAALQSVQIFEAAGVGLNPDTFMMSQLASDQVAAPFYILALAGLVMVATLWMSKKTKNVIETSVNLSRQNATEDKFQPNYLSRIIVRFFVYLGYGVSWLVPKRLQRALDAQFEVEASTKKSKELKEEPAFDMVRASVNLIVASILISMGTALKLPLSTTYVTFMVAMGSAFADKAWDRESAVFRVAGVLKVISGWFVTAFAAFSSAFILVYFLKIGGVTAFVALLILLGILLFKNAKFAAKREKEDLLKKEKLNSQDLSNIAGVLKASSDQIGEHLMDVNRLYRKAVNDLAILELAGLKEVNKEVKVLDKNLDSSNSNLYNFIRDIDETSLAGSRHYILALGALQDIVGALKVISNNSYNHVNNNHKKLKFNQIKELKIVEERLHLWLQNVGDLYAADHYEQLDVALAESVELKRLVTSVLDRQILRIRTSENSPKNSKLYFSILIETLVLIRGADSLLHLYKEFIQIKKTGFTL